MGHNVISFTAVFPAAERRLRVPLALMDRKRHFTCCHDTVFSHQYWTNGNGHRGLQNEP